MLHDVIVIVPMFSPGTVYTHHPLSFLFLGMSKTVEEEEPGKQASAAASINQRTTWDLVWESM